MKAYSYFNKKGAWKAASDGRRYAACSPRSRSYSLRSAGLQAAFLPWKSRRQASPQLCAVHAQRAAMARCLTCSCSWEVCIDWDQGIRSLMDSQTGKQKKIGFRGKPRDEYKRRPDCLFNLLHQQQIEPASHLPAPSSIKPPRCSSRTSSLPLRPLPLLAPSPTQS